MIAAILVILAAHWVADLPCQTTWMRMEKWHSWKALSAHAAVYASVLWGGSSIVFIVHGRPFGSFVAWMLVNGLAHFVQDAITSRVTHRLWFVDMKKISPSKYCGVCDGYRYTANLKPTANAFFNVICGDQILHAATLLGTAAWWLR